MSSYDHGIPDPLEQQARIPVQWIDGSWQLIGGGKLPAFEPNTRSELLVAIHCLTDEGDRMRWFRKETIPFLPKGQLIYVQVAAHRIPEDLKTLVKKHPYRGVTLSFVLLTLEDDLTLTTTPGKTGKLSEGACVIPALNESAHSLNEAYRMISQKFEPSRRSYGGNVFLNLHVMRAKTLVRLDAIRDGLTAAREAMQDRCESWLELALSWSHIAEVWKSASDAPFPPPRATTEALDKAVRDYYGVRLHALYLRSSDPKRRSGVKELMEWANTANPPKAVWELLVAHREMDRQLLFAYGWQEFAGMLRYRSDAPSQEDTLPGDDRTVCWSTAFARNVRDRLLWYAEQQLEDDSGSTLTGDLL